jgi:branched-subunit amino acid aminotransferase/4-amino-4-deoxychorismate lyase
VYVTRPDGAESIMVTVREPGEPPPSPMCLLTVDHQRTAAHLKHSTGFGQEYHRRAARGRGYDEALLAAPDGVISEGGITNVGCWDGSTLVWPDAPALAGVTIQLLQRSLPSVRRTLRVGDLASYEAVFVCNSRGIALVDRVDDRSLPAPAAVLKMLLTAYDAVDWDRI